MKTITNYIIENTEFSNSVLMKEILDESGLNYNLRKSKYQDEYEIKDSTINVLFVVKTKDNKNKPVGLYASSRADDADFVLEIFDNFNKYKNNEKLFNILKKKQYQEANNWKCAQWGTWKFIVDSMDELEELVDIISGVL